MNLGTSLIGNVDLILAGMFYDQNSAAKDLNAKQNAFAKLLYEDIRSIYDSYMPNIHVLDADNAASLIVAGIIKDPSSVLSISDSEYIPLVQEALSKAAPKLRKSIRDGVAEMHEKFSKRTKNNPVRELNTKLSLYIRDRTRRSNGILSNDSYIDIGKYFNSIINETFPKNVALLGISAESVGISSRPGRYIFFQKSFTSGKDTINKSITAALVSSIEDVKAAMMYANIQKVSSVTGKFIDFGHVGARDNTTIYINTPALVKVIYNAINLSTEIIKTNYKDVNKARDIFITKTGHVSQAIEVNKQFSYRAGCLISIGLTITTEMESEFNRKILGGKEARISDRASADALNSSELMRKGLADRLKDTFLGKNLSNTINSTSSYSLAQYLQLSVGNALTGKPNKEYSQGFTRKKSNNIQYNSVSQVTGEVVPAKQPKTYPQIGMPLISNLVGHSYPLTALQSLLNEYLPRQIKGNMGDGSATNVLNYRTGRFAESAKVERLSVSRQGMITAFYTYMKNPYATFSVGGAQSMPTSRDPKLLISKSIREIAANRVANRMRAVLV